MIKFYLAMDKKDGKRTPLKIDELIDIETPGEFHTSICHYSEEIITYIDKNKGSCAGYSGAVYGDFFVMDLDSKGDIDGATKAAISIMQYLQNRNMSPKIFFSGMKGWHIYVHKKHVTYPQELETMWNTCNKLFAMFIIKELPEVRDYVDTQIYTKVSMIRMPFSRHPASNNKKLLCKIKDPLYTKEKKVDINGTFEWIMGRDKEIKRDVFAGNDLIEEGEIPKVSLLELYKEQKTTPIKKEYKDQPKTLAIPWGEKHCIFAMKNDRQTQERHNVGIRLVIYYKEKGMSKAEVNAMINIWNNSLDKPMENSHNNASLDKMVLSVYDNQYTFTCNDSIKQKYCSPTCVHFKSRNVNEELVQAGGQHAKRLKEIKDQPEIEGLKMDKHFSGFMKAGIVKQFAQIMVISAASGVGKTSILLNIMLKFRNFNFLFFSYDMTKDEVLERMSAMLNLGVDTASDSTMFDELTKHIDIIDDTEIPIENIQSTIITTMEQRSRRYDIVAYDYLDQIRAKGASDTERNSAAAKELRKIGKALHIAQIVLTQVPKEKGGDGNIPIGKDAPMHSGTIVSIAHLLLLFWRPGLGKPEQDNEMACKIGKNRSGKADYVIFFKWIGEQFKLENR